MGRIIVTGGAGYIGSHTCKHLAAHHFEPLSYDNLVHGHRDAVRWGPLVVGDIRDQPKLRDLFTAFKPEAVIHFAAFAYVEESVSDPGKYYNNNVGGTIALLDAMRATGVDRIVFSSTCATYGIPSRLPIDEGEIQSPITPYGRSKLMIEQILDDYSRAYGLRYVTLRYFNAAGADACGDLGERHQPETHAIPRALMAAAGSVPDFKIYGDDYPTPDGTCIRDYIHVSDLANAHFKALNYLEDGGNNAQLNLGTGQGVSIAELLTAIEKTTGVAITRVVTPRRPGDPPALVADPTKARELLGFKACHSDIDTIISTAWRFLCNG
jgi:UDP-arabinose 4-epimerase